MMHTIDQQEGLLKVIWKHLRDDVHLAFWDEMNKNFCIPPNPLDAINSVYPRLYLPHGEHATRRDVNDLIERNVSLPLEERFLPYGMLLHLTLTPREDFIHDSQAILRSAFMRYDRPPYGFGQQALLAMTFGDLSVIRANNGGIRISHDHEERRIWEERVIACGPAFGLDYARTKTAGEATKQDRHNRGKILELGLVA